MIQVSESRDFGKLGDSAPIPNLIQLQTESYARFLMADVPPEKRKNEGLEALLREVFPISSYDENVTLEYKDYSLGKPRYTPDECRQLRLTYGMPLRVALRLSRKDTDEVPQERSYLGDIPVMIGGGEFIINGAERVIVSQLHRSPGVDFIKETLEGDRALHACRIIPERGSWVEIEITRKDVLAVRIDQASKIPATMFLRAMDARFSDDATIVREFYETKVVRSGNLRADMYAVSDIRAEDEPAKGEATEPLVRAGCPIGEAVGRIIDAGAKQGEGSAQVVHPPLPNTVGEEKSRCRAGAL